MKRDAIGMVLEWLCLIGTYLMFLFAVSTKLCVRFLLFLLLLAFRRHDRICLYVWRDGSLYMVLRCDDGCGSWSTTQNHFRHQYWQNLVVRIIFRFGNWKNNVTVSSDMSCGISYITTYVHNCRTTISGPIEINRCSLEATGCPYVIHATT